MHIIYDMVAQNVDTSFISIPDPATRVLVNERISKELEYGIVKETTAEEFNGSVY